MMGDRELPSFGGRQPPRQEETGRYTLGATARGSLVQSQGDGELPNFERAEFSVRANTSVGVQERPLPGPPRVEGNGHFLAGVFSERSASGARTEYERAMTDLFNRAYLGRSPEGHILYDPSVLPDHGLGLMMPPSPGVQTNIAEDGSDDELIRMLSGADARPPLSQEEVDRLLVDQARYVSGRMPEGQSVNHNIVYVDDRQPLAWNTAWGSGSGWPRWTASIASGTGGLIHRRVLITNAHVVAGKTPEQLSVELGEYAWTVSPSKYFAKGGGHNTRLLHPPIPVTAVVRPPFMNGLHHIDYAFVVLTYEPKISTMLLSATIPPGTFAGDIDESLKKSLFKQFIGKIDPSKPWGHFGLSTYISAFCDTRAAMLGGRVWNGEGPKELQANGKMGNPDYQTWQSMWIGGLLGYKDGGMKVRHYGDSVPGMSGSPIVKIIDKKLICIGVNRGQTGNANDFASGPAMVLGAGLTVFASDFFNW